MKKISKVTAMVVFIVTLMTTVMITSADNSYLSNYTQAEIQTAKSYLDEEESSDAAYIYNTLLNNGYSETATLGIMAAMMQVDEPLSGTQQNAYGVGICNFDANLLNYYALDTGEAWPYVSLTTQLNYMLSSLNEMNWMKNTEQVEAFKSTYGEAYVNLSIYELKSAQNALQAAVCFMAGYMNCDYSYEYLSALFTNLDNTIYILSYIKNNFSYYAKSSIVYDYTLDAVLYALDDTHGYMNVSGSNTGNPNFDCGGFITRVLRDVGIMPDSVIYEPNDGLQTVPLNYGFTSYTFTSMDDLQPGDILYNYGHTEMYIGNGLLVGAKSYGDTPASGDQTGKEVCVHSFSDNPSWELYYRYNE